MVSIDITCAIQLLQGYLPEINSLRGSNFDVRPDKEDAVRRESDDIIESFIIHVDDLQNITRSSTKDRRVLNDEELLLLGSPKQPPRGGEGAAGGDCVAAGSGDVVNRGDYLGELLGVGLSPQATVLVGDEAEEVVLGGYGSIC